MRPKLFFQYLKLSLTQTSFYLKLLKKPKQQLVWFYLMSLILWGLIAAARINWQTLPKLQTQLETSLVELSQHYPSDLILSWDGQKLTATPTAQLGVEYPSSWQPLPAELPKKLAFIDLETNDLPQSDHTNLVLINSQTFYLADFQGEWLEQPLSQIIPDQQLTLSQENLPMMIEITKNTINSLINKSSWLIWLVSPVGLLITASWSALINGAIIFFLLKINQVNLSLRNSLRLSFHLTIVATLINQIAGWLYSTSSLSIFSLSYWLILLYVLWTRRSGLAQLSTDISKSTGGKGRSS